MKSGSILLMARDWQDIPRRNNTHGGDRCVTLPIDGNQTGSTLVFPSPRPSPRGEGANALAGAGYAKVFMLGQTE